MPLKLELKPREKLFLGGAVIVNGDTRCQLTVMNDVPLLREKEILTEELADTPCKRIYLSIQLMYIDPVNRAGYQRHYWELARDVLEAAPSTHGFITDISENIMAERYYRALKSARELIHYEQGLTQDAQKSG
jgi:flagellar biosynthesis repressor protein FlbT